MSTRAFLETATTREISVILPVFNEADCIRATLYERFAVLDGLAQDYEVIAVNDGSRDATPAILAEIRATRPRLRVLTLTRPPARDDRRPAGRALDAETSPAVFRG